MGTRRSFILRLLALCGCGNLVLAGCEAPSDAPTPIRRVRLGSLGEFTAPSRILFLERVLVRRDERGISAMSLTCTHQSCMVQKQSSENDEYLCPCHGSRFDPSGKLLQGPAQRDLPWLPLEIDNTQQIWATFGSPVTSEWRLSIPAPA